MEFIMNTYLLAIDQGTTNSRAIIFNQNSQLISSHEMSLTQSYPQPGWVEQNPEEIFTNTILCCHAALSKANIQAKEIAAIGISNQRETTIIWDKITGKPIHPAIVWQDRRTADICKVLSQTSIANFIPDKTGLLLDPYFSATKIIWLLDHVAYAREKAMRGELLFGTVDCYLLWHLTGGKIHATDVTNASRTMLYNIKDQCWDDEILSALMIPKQLLPTVFDNTHDYGVTDKKIFGVEIAIAGMAGDQQAATIGQACFEPGATKVTFGTGGFLLMNTGNQVIRSSKGLLSTVAYRLQNQMTYGLEGSFFSAGVSIKWLRDTLKILKTAAESEELASQLTHNDNVYLIPAFTGLGAPYWRSDVQAAIFGLTRNTGPAYLARAALESVAYQTKDLLDAMIADYLINHFELNVDGGMAANNWLLQFLADMTRVTIKRPQCIESSALGAAYLAGLQVGIFKSLEDIKSKHEIDRTFTKKMNQEECNQLYRGWEKAINKLFN